MKFTDLDLLAIEVGCLRARLASLHARNAAIWERAKSHAGGNEDLMDEHAQLRAEDDRLERAIAVLQGQERAP